jgi:Lrp/AsnC family leucine-responsive transcriptional regulator
MRGLDETDREILRLLLQDGRRPYSEIAEAVDLSPPAVSDRVDRLREIGLVRRFTVDIDRSLLREGSPVLVTVQGTPGTGEQIQDALRDNDAVEYVFRTVDDTVVCTATVPDGTVGSLLADVLPLSAVREYDVQLLEETRWSPRLAGAEFAPECVECGNTVTSEGERERLEGTVYHFCCASCQESFLEQYQRLSEGA